MTSEKRKFGNLGEEIACRYLLEKKKWDIWDRNYLKKWGEIDIVSREIGKYEDIIHFVEVKSVSRENIEYVSREKLIEDLPEQKVNEQKLRRLHRVINSYLDEKGYVSRENSTVSINWQIDIIAVFLDKKNKKARVRMTENVLIEE